MDLLAIKALVTPIKLISFVMAMIIALAALGLAAKQKLSPS